MEGYSHSDKDLSKLTSSTHSIRNTKLRLAHIEVEPPVTRCPPHRSLRAVFPHRAPRFYSLALVQFTPLPRFYFGSWNLERFKQFIDTCPIITFSSTATIKPLINCPNHKIIVGLKTLVITNNTVVIPVSPKFPSKRLVVYFSFCKFSSPEG